MNTKIDIVIPWVDGGDSDWAKKKSHFRTGMESSGEGSSNNRYRDYDTLRYVLRSIEKNMKWVNNVFLLTDDQKPNWLKEGSLRLVDHKDFIRGNLPTFNSNAIVTSIGNIDSLAEHFILFNDEMIVWKKVPETAFFKNSLPVDSLIETGTVPDVDGFFHISQNGVALVNSAFSKRETLRKHLFKFFNWHYGMQGLRTVMALPYGGFIGFYNQHLVIPYLKTDFKKAIEEFPDVFRSTWSHRFRSSNDVNDWAVRYLRNVRGEFIPGFLKGELLTVSDFSKDEVTIKNGSQIVVVNDDGCSDGMAFEHIEKFLKERFPEKSNYEV